MPYKFLGVLLVLLLGWISAVTAPFGAENTAVAKGLTAADWATIQTILPSDYHKASNTDAGDFFGRAVAVDGDTVVVGAYQEASNGTGVNGDQTDNSVFTAGAVYVLVRTGGVWSQQAYIKASNTEEQDRFGYAVAIDGDTLIVGADLEDSNATGVNNDEANNSANGSGAVYVFTRNPQGVWSQQAYLKASNTGVGDRFGSDVDIAGDTIVVGAVSEASNAIGVNGNQADNSAAQAGAAYVFTRTDGVWSQQAYLKASNTGMDDQFGLSVAVAGDTIVVGAFGEASNATGVNGNQADNSAAQAGAAYVFTRTDGVWSQQAYLKASNAEEDDRFGEAVALDGETIVVGARYEQSSATGVNGDQTNNDGGAFGAAYVFARTAGVWSQEAYLKPSNMGSAGQFGIAVAINGNFIVVGAHRENKNAIGVNGIPTISTIPESGAAYVFARTAGVWEHLAYLKASNTGANDFFGWAVAVDSKTVVVGSFGEGSQATGANGDQADNSAVNSGAVYLFRYFQANNAIYLPLVVR